MEVKADIVFHLAEKEGFDDLLERQRVESYPDEGFFDWAHNFGGIRIEHELVEARTRPIALSDQLVDQLLADKNLMPFVDSILVSAVLINVSPESLAKVNNCMFSRAGVLVRATSQRGNLKLEFVSAHNDVTTVRQLLAEVTSSLFTNTFSWIPDVDAQGQPRRLTCLIEELRKVIQDSESNEAHLIEQLLQRV